MEWAEAVLEVAEGSGMKDDTVIPTWPADMPPEYPPLTVGAVRKLVAKLEAAERLHARLEERTEGCCDPGDPDRAHPCGQCQADLAALTAWDSAK